jgi:hypothetical protein
MKNGLRKYGLIMLAIAWAGSCKHPFEPQIFQHSDHLLVVSGFINAEPGGVTTITLTRSQNIVDTTALPVPELYARIAIEGEGGEIFGLTEKDNGDYVSQPLNLNQTGSYRLKITTNDGKDYLSDLIPVKLTPPIDSITWRQQNDVTKKNDVTVYVNSHDPNNDTRYYRWDFTETWQYSSSLSGIWGLKGNLVIYKNDSSTQTDSCWRTAESKNINITNTLALSEDVVSAFPLTIIANADERISVRYSILVRQYALTPEAYQYRSNLQKNTELNGTIFDPQPLQLVSNMHCTSNPNEPVIGYISASTVQQKRIFIRHTEVTDWHYHGTIEDCHFLEIPVNPVYFGIWSYPDPTYDPYYFSGSILHIAKKSCLECQFWGGTTSRPSFW